AASREDRTVCCARCGEGLTLVQDSSARDIPFEELPELPEFDDLSDWEFDETLQDAEHLVRRIATDARGDQHRTAWNSSRGPKSVSATGDTAACKEGGCQSPAEASWPVSASGVVLPFALAVFVCGVALISLSLISQRPLLWELGVPMALAGQVAVLAVVVWQLNAAWNGNRATFVALHAVDDQVRELRNDWSKIQRANTDAFYDHLAEGASPEVLLADLKDQIEVLSDYLDQTERAA
ncbi:MAG: hypothetical protein R6U98_16540, partial [Pirellulaceae bacterium]